jgi:hypothetical protein
MLFTIKKQAKYLVAMIAFVIAFFSACKKESTDSNGSDPNVSGTSTTRRPAPSGCQYYNYPLLYYPNNTCNTISPPAITFINVKNFYDETDPSCDFYEFAYAGTNWVYIRPITQLGIQATTPPDPNNPWGFRVRIDGTQTKVFAPKAYIDSWFGSPAAFNDNIRLGKSVSGPPCPGCVPLH